MANAARTMATQLAEFAIRKSESYIHRLVTLLRQHLEAKIWL